MSSGFYTKLAWNGIKKNKQLYYPYLAAGIAMVMVFYVFSFLGASRIVQSLPGKEVLPTLFEMGAWAIGLFSIPFLFYTNSALIKKRKKELGLYNILGMNKKNIFSVLLWETAISCGIVVIGGIFFGIVFSKVAELGLVNIMDKQINYRIYVEWRSVLYAVLMFTVIYFLILMNSLYQIHNNNPIELLHSDSAGERPPQSRRVLTVSGVFFIGLAYYLLVKQRNPMKNMEVLAAGIFIAAGTFLLFICAAVFLCRVLQNNKKYYYQTSHFVTVSTMSFRMRRNGASLAAICILVTLILATLAFSASFYVGAMDTINKHYPYDIGVSVKIPREQVIPELSSETYAGQFRSALEHVMQGHQEAEITEAYSANMMGLMTDGHLDLSSDMRDTWYTPGHYDGWERENQKIVYVHMITLDTYNQLCQTAEELNDEQVLVASETINYKSDSMTLPDGEEVHVNKIVNQIPGMTEVRLDGASLDTHGCEQIFVVVSDLYASMGNAEGNYASFNWEYDINMPGTDAELQKVYDVIDQSIQKTAAASGDLEVTSYLRAEKGERFYALAGGLLFIAIIINILFVFVAALIMYYKQISEGYEDQRRFQIMRKIGMTKSEIKKSIRSQTLTVFSLPLLVAGVHFIFTTNIVHILLKYAVVDNRPLLIKVMCICYLIFAVIYSLVYLWTSRTYFKIVNK